MLVEGAIVLGVINGLLIALLAVGFVLIYKANRFLNLAHAQLGVISALLLAKVVNDWHWNWWASFLACVAVGVLTAIVVERFLVSVVRRRSKSPVRLMMLSIGVGQLLLGLTFVPSLSPSSQAPFPQPFSSQLEVGGVVLSGAFVLTLIVVPILLVALTVFLEFSSIGKQIRAAASNPDAALLCGISVERSSLLTWALAGGLSALAAVLIGPTTTSFNAQALGPFALLLTMGAASFGAFVSIPAAVGGGLGLGIVYQLTNAETSNAGTAELVVFGVILFVILVRRRAIGEVFATHGAAVPDLPGLRIPESMQASKFVKWLPRCLVIAALAVAGVFPHLPYFSEPGNQFLLVLVLIYAVIGVGLTVLLGWAGQVSLGSVAIVGIAAFLTARWSGHSGWSLLDMLPAAGLAGACVSVVIGLPALRARGLALAVATLGLAVIAPDWLLLRPWLGGSTPFTTSVSPTTVLPGFGHIVSEQDAYYVVLVVLVLVIAATRSLRRSTAGRTIIAVRDNEEASAAFGISPTSVKLRVLAASGFIAAMAGVLWALAWQTLSPAQFPASLSIAVLALPVIGGLGSLGGVVAAAVLFYMGTFFIGPHVSGLFGSFGQNEGFLLFFSGLGVVSTMVQAPNGIAGQVQRSWQSYLNRRSARGESEISVERTGGFAVSGSASELVPDARLGALPRSSESAKTEDVPLVVSDVSLRFGGVVALSSAGLRVNTNEVVGLIGPNGAGKTSLMNVISGVVQPDAGSVRLFGHEVCGRSPTIRSHCGMARSFQDSSLFAGLTVAETVQLAMADRSRTGIIASLLRTSKTRTSDRRTQQEAAELISMFGMAPWADALTAELSTGMRRVCNLMAQVATGPRLLLLDEPTAGMAQREAETFGPLVRRIREQLGCSILVIEHDVPLIMGLCDRVYAMELGRIVSEGTPEQVRNDPVVVASYLGAHSSTIHRSGR